MNDFFDELNNFSNLLEINEKEEEKIKEKKYTNTTSYEDKQLKKEINEFTKITKIYRDCEKSHKKINKIIKEMNSKILIVYGYNILMEENLKTMLNYVNMSILKTSNSLILKYSSPDNSKFSSTFSYLVNEISRFVLYPPSYAKLLFMPNISQKIGPAFSLQ